MRLLHTSDWHLGRGLHGFDLAGDQADALDALVAIARDQSVDLVVIAGDLYDRALPPTDSVRLFEHALTRLREVAPVVAISGNHDSGPRVGAFESILGAHGLVVRGTVERTADPVALPIDDGGPPVVIYPIPYLDPLAAARAAQSLEGHPTEEGGAHDGIGVTAPPVERTHEAAIRWALQRARRDVEDRGGAGAVRSIVVAHAFVAGGAPSDSERPLAIGGTELVPADLFDGFDYVALGHLHGHQILGDGRVAYSGSILPYSFSEERHTKGCDIVELRPDHTTELRHIAHGAGRRMETLEGTIDGLLQDRRFAEAEHKFVRIRLTDDPPPAQAMPRLQERFPFAVSLEARPGGRERRSIAGAGPDPSSAEELATEDLLRRFWEACDGEAPNEAEWAILRAAITEVEGVPT